MNLRLRLFLPLLLLLPMTQFTYAATSPEALEVLHRIESTKRWVSPAISSRFVNYEGFMDMYKYARSGWKLVHDPSERQEIVDSLMVFPTVDDESLTIKIHGVGHLLNDYPKAHEWILANLEHGNQKVVRAAIQVLVWRDQVDLVRDRIIALGYYEWAVGYPQKVDRELLMEGALHAGIEQGWYAFGALKKLGAVDELASQTDSILTHSVPNGDLISSWKVYVAIRNVTETQNVNMIPRLIEFVNDSTYTIRRQSLRTLGLFADQRNTEAILALNNLANNHPEAEVRGMAKGILFK